MVKKFFTWLGDKLEASCDVCDDKFIDLYSDQWGMIMCRKCFDEDVIERKIDKEKRRSDYLKRIKKGGNK